jgi:hypothetical protein
MNPPTKEGSFVRSIQSLFVVGVEACPETWEM